MNDVSGSQRARQLVEELHALPVGERPRFLREQCEGNPALRDEVESILAASDSQQRGSMAQTMDPSSADARLNPTTIPSSPPRAPEQIGPYKLLEIIGEGGFGTVWVADQQQPVRRRVALKIIKPGMDSRAVIARFEQERQALAIMEHANIARVLDAGTAPDGRPFFVMEYVPGEAITTYCDRNRLSVQQRLELFIPICEAVQHAHHKGIIHRDIKPTNVLVSIASGAAAVKVIDFGVAKAVSHVLTDKTIFTEHGQILGTPEYMSPEQAEMGALDIDTRTDVYSLGVLLYELLTGALPFEPRDLRSKGYNEIQRIIREVDPPKPSTRLRSLGAISKDVCQRRQAKLDELEGQLRRELEWIPLKAMRKDRRERYATPVALADDIRNHLAGRPLVAGPESAIYRARKFVTRNRGPVAAAAMVLIALTLGAILSTIGFVTAARNARLAEAEAKRANTEAQRANSENRILRQQHVYNTSLLANANPLAGERKDITVRELLDGAALQLDQGAQAGQPRIEAGLRATLAMTYRSLSMWDAAEQQWRKAIDLESGASGPESPEVAFALSGLGQVQMDTRRLDEAKKSLDEALSIQRELLKPDDSQLGDTLGNLGYLAHLSGDYKTAMSHYREALAIYEKNSDIMAPKIADILTNLAVSLNYVGDNQQAMELARKGLEIRRKRLGEKHIDVLNSLLNVASIEEAQDDLDSAVRTRREAVALASELLDEKNRNSIRSNMRLARTLWLRGGPALDEAQALQTRALEIARSTDGDQSPFVAEGLDLLGCIARDRGDMARSVDLFQQALTVRKSLPSEPDIAAAMSQLADALTRVGQPQDALKLAQTALEARTRLLPKGHNSIWITTSVLGGAYAASGDFGKAEPLLVDAFKGLEKAGRRWRMDAARRLVALYEKWGKPDEAAEWRRLLADLSAPMASAVKP